MIAIYKRELKSYFSNVTGWLFIGILLIFTGYYTNTYNLTGMSARFEYPLASLASVYIFAVPILTMRSVSDEKQNKTDQLLYSLPMKLSSVIIGKYLAMVTITFITCLVIACYPVVISLFGIIDYTVAYTTLLGFFLLSCALIAIGLFISSLTESMVISAVLTFAVIFLSLSLEEMVSTLPTDAASSFAAFCIIAILIAAIVYLLTKSMTVSLVTASIGIIPTCIFYLVSKSAFEGLFPSLAGYVSIFGRFYTFANGIFDLTAILFYVSVAVFFVFLSVLSLEKKRWN